MFIWETPNCKFTSIDCGNYISRVTAVLRYAIDIMKYVLQSIMEYIAWLFPFVCEDKNGKYFAA